MGGDVVQDSGDSADAQLIVAGDSDVVLGRLGGCESHVAAGLAGDPLSERGERLDKVVTGDDRGAGAWRSSGEDFIADDVQAHHGGARAGLEMAVHGIEHGGTKLLDGAGLGENRFPESAGSEAAFRGLLDMEDDFGHDLRSFWTPASLSAIRLPFSRI